jgi:arylsulfate sulfotransferase
MEARRNGLLCLTGLLAMSCVPAFGTVQIVSVKPSAKSPQLVGKVITWTVTATDSNPGPLTFQFSVTPPGGAKAVVKDYNVGTLSAGTWTAQPFVWAPTSCTNVVENSGVVALTCGEIEGTYKIQVIAKDFVSSESNTKTVQYAVNPLVTGTSPVVAKTSNPLVAIFGAPSCASGSLMRVNFQQQSKATPATTTNWVSCHPPTTMNFEVAGMYPSTTYQMFAQTLTSGKITNGSTVSFTTGALPTNVPFSTAKVIVGPGPQTDTTDSLILLNPIPFGGQPTYANVATDLSGNVMWYYYNSQSIVLTRPLLNGTMLTIQNGSTWNPASTKLQLLRQIDLVGNIIRETNIGILSEQLLKMGVTDAQSCNTISKPAPVGSACLGAFHHDAIQTLPGGYTALFADVEKIFPAGTQGDTSGLPVDIMGDLIIVLDTNWQVKWSFDTFQHDGGAPQLDINRAAILGEGCVANQQGCPPIFLLGTGIAPKALDWLHANSLYYWGNDSAGGASGDIVWSARDQDWVMKIDYNNGTGTGNILWRMGPSGDFTFNNINNDPWPWFSHQHDVGMENNGAGPMTIFDNGDTRVSPPPVGLGSGNSRGMSLTVNESTMQVTPVLSQDLGAYSPADGSAQLLADGNYFFLDPVVLVNLTTEDSYAIQIFPTSGTVNGTQVLNIQNTDGYRGWEMSSLYNPPIT